MNFKAISILFLVLLLWGCKQFEETTFSVSNRTDTNLQVTVFERWSNKDYEISPGHSQVIKTIKGMDGTDFEIFFLIDSVVIKERTAHKTIKWYRPDNQFGYIGPQIGEERPIPKDFYNKSNWAPKHKINKDEWYFNISQEDLKWFY